MDTRTGKIYEMTEAEAKEKRLTRLSPKEYQEMLGVPEEDRPVELALHRFWVERMQLKAPFNVAIKNAFRCGYRAALKDQQ
jgi:hypothetical protein